MIQTFLFTRKSVVCFACCICPSVWLSLGKFVPPCSSQILCTSVVAGAIRMYVRMLNIYFEQTSRAETWVQIPAFY